MYMCNVHITMWTEFFYPLQNGHTPLLLAACRGDPACIKLLLSTPGIDVNIGETVSWYIAKLYKLHRLGHVCDECAHNVFAAVDK